jgi:trehalose-6-phosphatase
MPGLRVSGRDRQVVQELMRIDDLVVAGSHGFCFVVEDAASGVEAAKVDLVVASLDEVDVERLARHAVSRRAS